MKLTKSIAKYAVFTAIQGFFISAVMAETRVTLNCPPPQYLSHFGERLMGVEKFSTDSEYWLATAYWFSEGGIPHDWQNHDAISISVDKTTARCTYYFHSDPRYQFTMTTDLNVLKEFGFQSAPKTEKNCNPGSYCYLTFTY